MTVTLTGAKYYNVYNEFQYLLSTSLTYSTMLQAVALVCGAQAAPQFNGDPSLARILQEQR